MAAFTVSFDGTRVVDASSTTGWTAEGATPTAEPDFFYQGTGSISAKVKTTEVGFYYTSSSTDMTTPRVALLKMLATNKDVLDGNGMVFRIGSATTAYYEYASVFTATTYPIAGGWQVVCIDPNVAQWRSSTTGSPSLSAVVYWAFRADFSSTSKSENLAIDAIDYVGLGAGLTGIGGDGVSADGTFADFVTADEGTANNRWGVVQTRGGILYINGVLTIGSATETDFTDTNKVLVFPDHRVTTGFCGIDVSLANASSVISILSCTFVGRGALYTSDDTRPDYTVTGTAGVVDFTSCVFNVFRQIDFNSKVTANTTSFLNGLKVVADGADLVGSTFSGCTGAADVSYVFWDVATDVDGLLDDCTFVKGTTATHGIELGTSSPTSLTFRGITSSGYNASNAQNDSFFYVKRTTGTVTINVVGGTGNFSYKTDGATVVIVIDPVTTSVNVKDENRVNLQSARVYLKAADGTGPLPFEDSVTITRSGTTATVTHTAHGMATNDKVKIKGITDKTEDNAGTHTITVTGVNSYTYTTTDSGSTSYTGTITSTWVAIDGLTDANGNISVSKSYSTAQPVDGWVRKATTTPLYKNFDIAGTISTTTGLAINVQMIRDD